MEYHYAYYGGRGFRSRLEEAIGGRVGLGYGSNHGEDGLGSHVVDYLAFKRKLRKYSQRRAKLRRLMDGNDSALLIPEDVVGVLHFPEDTIIINNNSNNNNNNEYSRGGKSHRKLSTASSPVDCYLPMMNVEDDCNAELPGIWKARRRVLHRREIMRKVSGLEREGVALFLADETRRISEVYRSRTQFLGRQFLEWRTKMWRKREQTHHSIDIGSNNEAGESDEDIILENSGAMIRQTLLLGKALLDLEAFCVLNILVVRQTLLRYDAFARCFEGTPMMEFYLKSVLRSTAPHDGKGGTPNLYHHELRQILLHKEVRGLCLDFARHLDWLRLREHKSLKEQSKGTEEESSSEGRYGNWTEMRIFLETVAEQFRKDIHGLRRLVLSSAVDKTVALANENHDEATPALTKPATAATAGDFLMDVVAKYFFLGMYMEDQFGWYLDGTNTRGRSLTEEMKSLTDWKRKSDKMWSLLSPEIYIQRLENLNNVNSCGVGQVFLEGLECGDIVQCGTEEAIVDGNKRKENPFDASNHEADSSTGGGNYETEGVTKQQKFNLIMALTAGFLYCMNYYIVEPSSTMYVNALGAHDAAGATLIGMMPIASFLAAIVYSIWTNTVFRQPFLVSCSLMVTGNIIYSSAFNYKSLTMALLGRFLTGLGGPKMIVRRYMADTTSVNIRTSVNAGFGMVVAAGSALGPGCAILLSTLNFIVPLPGGSELWFNSMTAPGWFMATLWSFFSIALFWGFQEQERIGLTEKLEQDKMERENERLWQERETEIVSTNRVEKGVSGNSIVNEHRIREGIPEEYPVRPASGTTPTTNGDQNPVTMHWNEKKSQNDEKPVAHATVGLSSGQTKQSVSIGDESARIILMAKSSLSMTSECYHEKLVIDAERKCSDGEKLAQSLWIEVQNVSRHLLFPVRICMGLLFAKVFVIETLVSCTSVLSKNRYGWTIHQVGLLGSANGFFVIPLSFVVGKLSLQYQDRYLMVWLLTVGMTGLCLLVDVTDLIDTSEAPQTYNKYLVWSVGPIRYVMGYFVTYLSIQSFEGIIGSALSKLIPTALARGTFNSGLLATLVDTFGRSCGDLFISLMGFSNIRQLMNLLFVPGVMILVTCLVVVRKHYDLLAV